MKVTDASVEDCVDLAFLINLAGEGIPEFLWQSMAVEGESAMDVGMKLAAREEGDFTYKNVRVIKDGNKVAAMLLAYQLADPYVLGDLSQYPEVIRPMNELESEVPGSWYINAIATYGKYRGQGLASELMKDAEQIAKNKNIPVVSLIVASENLAAKKLYLRLGYQVVDSRPVFKFSTAFHGGLWELMKKEIE